MNASLQPPRRAAGWILILSAAIPSCGGPSGEVPVYPTKGQVKLQGKPLAGVLVVLHPVEPLKENPPPLPTGQTDAEGRFQLRTYFGTDGAPAGSYRVAVVAKKASQESAELSTLAANKNVKPAPRVEIDGRYNDPMTSGLKVEITAGDNQIPPLELK